MSGAISTKIFGAAIAAGTLDIISASVYAMLAGRTPAQMLRGVASAILGDGARRGGTGAAGFGLALHFTIMTAMAAAYVLAVAHRPGLRRRWLGLGVAYGLLTWAIMNLVVLPLRWPALFPTFAPTALTQQLFSHVVLVGLPIAWIAARPDRGCVAK